MSSDDDTVFRRFRRDTTRIYRKFMPVDVPTFREKIRDGDEGEEADTVKIVVKAEGSQEDPLYRIAYQAYEDDDLILQAKETFDVSELRQQHLSAEGDCPEDLHDRARNCTSRKVKDMKEALSDREHLQIKTDLPEELES